MIGLTKREADLLKFIRTYRDSHGGAIPTFDEMVVGIGIRSKSGISRMILSMEQRGAVRRLRNRSRAIEIVEEPDAVAAERERCAKLADDYAARCGRGSATSSMAEDAWGAQAGREIAKAIRGKT